MHTSVLAFHHRHLTFTFGHHIDDTACQLLNRLAFYTINFLDDNLRLPYLQFVSFTTHRLDQNRQVQYTTSVNQPWISRISRSHTQSQVLVQFFLQAFINMTRSHIFTIFTEERRVIDCKEHRHRRLINGNGRQSFRFQSIGNCLTNLKTFNTDHSTDITWFYRLYFRTAQSFEYIDFLDLWLYLRAIPLTQNDILSFT